MLSYNRRITLLVTTVLLSNYSMGAVGLRALGRASVAAEKTEDSHGFTSLVDSATRTKITKELTSNSAFRGLDPVAIETFIENLSNRSIEKVWRKTQNTLEVSKGNQVVSQIEALRIEIASLIKEMNIYDKQMVDKAGLNKDQMADFLIMRTLVEADSLVVGKDGQEFLKSFFEYLKDNLKSSNSSNQALHAALERLSMEKGLTFSVEDMRAAFSSSDGIMGLFKGINDSREYEVGIVGETKITVRMSDAQAEKVSRLAHGEAHNLIEIANNPGSLNARFASEALQSLRREQSDSNRYLEKNELLNKRETILVGEDVAKKTASNLDELLLTLKSLGAEVEKGVSTGKFVNAIKKYTGANAIGNTLASSGNSVIQKIGGALKVDPGAHFRKMELRKKIALIDQSIMDGINQLDKNNLTLNDMRAKAIGQINELQIEIAKTRLVSDLLQEYIHENESNRPQLIETIKAEIVPRIERELDSSMALLGVLRASVDAIDSVIKNNLAIISDSYHLKNIAAPAITVSEATKEAAIQAQNSMQRSKAIRNFVQQSLENMTEQTIKTNQVFTEMAGESTVDPVVLERVLSKLVQDKADTTKRLIQAGEKLRNNNAKLAGILNKYAKDLSRQSTGIDIGNAIRGSRGQQP